MDAVPGLFNRKFKTIGPPYIPMPPIPRAISFEMVFWYRFGESFLFAPATTGHHMSDNNDDTVLAAYLAERSTPTTTAEAEALVIATAPGTPEREIELDLYLLFLAANTPKPKSEFFRATQNTDT